MNRDLGKVIFNLRSFLSFAFLVGLLLAPSPGISAKDTSTKQDCNRALRTIKAASSVGWQGITATGRAVLWLPETFLSGAQSLATMTGVVTKTGWLRMKLSNRNLEKLKQRAFFSTKGLWRKFYFVQMLKLFPEHVLDAEETKQISSLYHMYEYIHSNHPEEVAALNFRPLSQEPSDLQAHYGTEDVQNVTNEMVFKWLRKNYDEAKKDLSENNRRSERLLAHISFRGGRKVLIIGAVSASITAAAFYFSIFQSVGSAGSSSIAEIVHSDVRLRAYQMRFGERIDFSEHPDADLFDAAYVTHRQFFIVSNTAVANAERYARSASDDSGFLLDYWINRVEEAGPEEREYAMRNFYFTFWGHFDFVFSDLYELRGFDRRVEALIENYDPNHIIHDRLANALYALAEKYREEQKLIQDALEETIDTSETLPLSGN